MGSPGHGGPQCAGVPTVWGDLGWGEQQTGSEGGDVPIKTVSSGSACPEQEARRTSDLP